ncbi:MAG: PKD domain-containing protein [Methanoregulaceae archaeon]|nr:PKD domain-containing protein [Methanoregulaceae archaeon]
MAGVLDESAVSRNLIILVIAAVAVIGIAAGMFLFLNQSGGSKVPRINATVETAENVVYVYHDGGDPLPRDRALVRINGVDIPQEAITLLHSQDWPWTAGKTMRIQYNGAGTPNRLDIYFTSGSTLTPVLNQQLAVQEALIPVSTITTPAPSDTSVPQAVSPTSTSAMTLPATPPATTAPGTEILGPPLADFAAGVTSGQIPLEVQFTDRSSGTPASWLWNFGDGGTSAMRNPSHTYTKPGSYAVSLTATNSLGFNTKTVSSYIRAGSSPVSNFAVMPRQGETPLEVRFSDLSSGQPDSWSWNFGDGGSSDLQNPVHTYGSPGTYSVSLTVGNNFGETSRILTNVITVTSSPTYDVYLTGSRYGYLEKDGYMTFTVTRPDAWIKIAGSIHTFSENDNVQLIIGDPASGMIDGTRQDISAFNFNLVRLYVNSVPVASGIVSDTRITGYRNLRSSITLVIPPEDDGAILYVNAAPVMRPPGTSIRITNFKPDSGGRMDFQKKTDEVYYKGGAEQYLIG